MNSESKLPVFKTLKICGSYMKHTGDLLVSAWLIWKEMVLKLIYNTWKTSKRKLSIVYKKKEKSLLILLFLHNKLKISNFLILHRHNSYNNSYMPHISCRWNQNGKKKTQVKKEKINIWKKMQILWQMLKIQQKKKVYH